MLEQVDLDYLITFTKYVLTIWNEQTRFLLGVMTIRDASFEALKKGRERDDQAP